MTSAKRVLSFWAVYTLYTLSVYEAVYIPIPDILWSDKQPQACPKAMKAANYNARQTPAIQHRLTQQAITTLAS